MGLFEKLFGSKGTGPAKWKNAEQFKMLTAYRPTFRHWNCQLYESELVRSAIHARATHISKLHVQVEGSANPKLQTVLKDRPNNFQTWGQFLYRTSTILDVTNNCIIVPTLDEYGDTVGFYPILPDSVELIAYDGVPFVRFHFRNGKWGAMELDRVGILTKHQFENDFFGASNDALTPTMVLINLQNQGIEEAIKNGATFRFMARTKNFTLPTDIAKEQQQFNENQLKAETGGGLLLFPNTYDDIRQIDSKAYTINAAQMQQINTNVFDYFGVNEDVLQNKAYGDAWSAFYEGAVEPFAIQFSDVMTRCAFTANERARGAQIFATANRLQYMSNTDKLNVSAQLADRGIMNRDEIREIWNLPPLPDGQGKAYIIRGEYYNADEKLTEDETGDNNNGN